MRNLITIKPQRKCADGCRQLKVMLNGELISDHADLVDLGILGIDVSKDGTINIFGKNKCEVVEDTFCGRKHRNLSTAIFRTEEVNVGE